MLAPVVSDQRCVGCGLCQMRCYSVNVKDRGVLKDSAIIIEAGAGKEDRIMSGSYVQLRVLRDRKHKQEMKDRGGKTGKQGGYLPEE